MKSTILTLSLSVIITVSAISVSAQEPNKEAEHARKELATANKNLDQAQKDSISDLKKFKADAILKIEKNDKDIAELKIRKKDTDKEIQKKYNKKVEEIEEKNNALRKQMDGYNERENNKWEIFKKEFNTKIDDLGKSISEMTKKVSDN